MKMSFRLPKRKNHKSNTKEDKKYCKKGLIRVPCVSEKRELRPSPGGQKANGGSVSRGTLKTEPRELPLAEVRKEDV